MSKLFDCSKIAQGSSFVGRKDELKKLSSHFVFQTNTVLLAPRGWGKTSLIFKAAEEKSVLFFWLYAVAYTLHIYFYKSAN